MRLVVSQDEVRQHTDIATALAFTPTGRLITSSDDGRVLTWNSDGERDQTVKPISLGEDVFLTDVCWFPAAVLAAGGASTSAAAAAAIGSQSFVAACTDGSFRFYSDTGRVEKVAKNAHDGAVLNARWNSDGSTLLTTGEDGAVKVWSRTGQLRSQLYVAETPAYGAAWGPADEAVIVTDGKHLVVKPLSNTEKETRWKAHEGVVLCVDWNPVGDLIVSGGEDRRYRVWDAFGRNLFSSRPLDYVVTSVAIAPSGEHFAVGSYDTLVLCDKGGWSHDHAKPSTGSLFRLAWTHDSTQVAGAGGTGDVCFAHIAGRRLEWREFEVVLTDSRKVTVHDVDKDIYDDLDFKDRVVHMSVGFGYLIVASASQCSVFAMQSLTTPVIFDTAGTTSLIKQSPRYFLLASALSGIQVYNYDGRNVSSPKYPGLRPHLLSGNAISLSDDKVAMVDRTDPQTVHICDVQTGALAANSIRHANDVLEVSLSFYGSLQDRKLAFIDANRDLYISTMPKVSVDTPPEVVKLGATVSSAIWNETSDMLAANLDGRFAVWYYPNVAFVARSLIASTTYTEAAELGDRSRFVSFYDTHCAIRNGADGSLASLMVSPYPALLYQYVSERTWDDAVRLCRFVKDDILWASLAVMAVNTQELGPAEIAFAQISEIDRLQYIAYIKTIPSEERRRAELHLFCGRKAEAELVLIQARMVYWAIDMNIKLFEWKRALELALKHKQHVETVIAFRQKHLADFGRVETDEEFLLHGGDVEVNWDAINAGVAEEEERERQRPGARPLA